jgi:hypothetical protein
LANQEVDPGAAAQINEVEEEAGYRRLMGKMRAVVVGEGAARLAGAVVVEEEGAARRPARW